MSYFRPMIIRYLEGGGTICEVHGINSKTCKRSKKCYVSQATAGIQDALKTTSKTTRWLS